MQAVVKTPHIEIKAKGKIPAKILNFFKKEYGAKFHIIQDSDSESFVDVTETDWYQKIKKTMKAGDYVKVYREHSNLTQAELGNILGGFTRQNVSEIEKGKRGISKESAKKLAKVFNKPVEKFL